MSFDTVKPKCIMNEDFNFIELMKARQEGEGKDIPRSFLSGYPVGFIICFTARPVNFVYAAP
jgi:hypothetical protein